MNGFRYNVYEDILGWSWDHILMLPLVLMREGKSTKSSWWYEAVLWRVSSISTAILLGCPGGLGYVAFWLNDWAVFKGLHKGTVQPKHPLAGQT